MTDPIADMITRLRNAVHARHQRCDVPASRFKAEIARILEQEGYIQGFRVVDAGNADRRDGPTRHRQRGGGRPRRPDQIFMKSAARRKSLRPAGVAGRPACIGPGGVPKVMGGLGPSISRPSRGVMTGRTRSGPGRRRSLCNVW